METNKEKYLQEKDNKSSYIALLENRLRNEWGLKYISNSQLKILPVFVRERSFDSTELTEYGFTQIQDNEYLPKGEQNIIRLKIDGRVYEETKEWTVDVTTTGIDLENKTCGIIDNIAKTNEKFYLLWAFADDSETEQNSENVKDVTVNYKSFKGFGLTKQPLTTASAVSGATKGSVGTFTVTNAFQFTTGSTVLVWVSGGLPITAEYNRATVIEITDNTILKLQMYSDASYGTDITTAVSTIIQVNNFKPFVVNEGGQTEYSNHYKLITGGIYIDGSGNLREFIYDSGYTYHPEVIELNNDLFSPGTHIISPYLDVPSTAFQCIFRTETSNKNVQFKIIGKNFIIFEFVSELLTAKEYVNGLLFAVYVSSNSHLTLKIDGFIENFY